MLVRDVCRSNIPVRRAAELLADGEVAGAGALSRKVFGAAFPA
jgi:hypothetical protein